MTLCSVVRMRNTGALQRTLQRAAVQRNVRVSEMCTERVELLFSLGVVLQKPCDSDSCLCPSVFVSPMAPED